MKKVSRRDFLKKGALIFSPVFLKACSADEYFVREGITYLSNIKTKIFYPISNKQHPLIAFSHGYTASPKMNNNFLKKIAGRGYIIVAPFHSDSKNLSKLDKDELLDRVTQISGYEQINFPEIIELFLLGVVGQVNNNDLIEVFNSVLEYRLEELSAVIEAAESFDKFDKENIGLIGMSYGGDTAIKKTIEDKKVKCSLLLSPISSFSDVSQIAAPTCWMTGTLDDKLYEPIKIAFENSQSPSSFISIKEAGHMTYSEEAVKWHNRINMILRLYGTEKVFTETDFLACQNPKPKRKAIFDAAKCFFDYWLKAKGSEDDFLIENEDIISEYIVK